MENKLTINLGKNKICAEVYSTGLDECPYELTVYLCDENDMIFQDICVVRPHYEYNRKKEVFETYDDLVDCIVWGESDNEDYTDKHIIGVREEEDV